MLTFKHISKLKIDRYSDGRVIIDGIVYVDYKRTPVAHLDHYFICFGYKGKDFALSTWAQKKSSGLGLWSATADKRLLWNTHLFYEKNRLKKTTEKIKLIGKEYEDYAESELNDISWLYLVSSAYNNIKKGVNIHIVYLSNYDYDTAKLYYDYCCWLEKNI